MGKRFKRGATKENIGSTKWELDYQDSKYSEDINQIEIADNEIVIEFDETAKDGSDKVSTIAERTNWIYHTMNMLDTFNIKYYVFDHKGKCQHIHIFSERDLTQGEKERVAKSFVKAEAEPFLDTSLFTNAHLINVPFSKHWRTGEMKKLLHEYGEHPIRDKDIPPKITSDSDMTTISVSTGLTKKIVSAIKITDIAKEHGLKQSTTQKNQFLCPFHKDKNPSLDLNDEKGFFHCFGCQASGNIIDLVSRLDKITPEEAKEKLMGKAKLLEIRPKVQLPQSKLISDFAKEILPFLRDGNELFYNTQVKSIVQIRNKEFHIVTAGEFITIVENYITPVIHEKKKVKVMENDVLVEKDAIIEKRKSMTRELSSTLLQSDILMNGLRPIKQIFTIPIPIWFNGELTFVKKGYDERFSSWLSEDSPDISNPNMSLKEAKEIINYIYKEFAFKTQQDLINAIAGLLTPYTRGLMSSFSVRTPFWFYMGNRERVGKDYCADITGIVYEGYAIQETPISTGESNSNSEELRKKIVSALLSGRKRLHFANNKGYLNNAALEMVLTAPKVSDRLLGKNVEVALDNLIDYSASGNVGIGFTPDLMNRSLFVNLFLDIENANARNFENPNLHGWVLENRNKVLSALYAFIRNWIEKDRPNGSVPFASYPEWAKIVGGIMETAEYENPCKVHEQVLAIGGDIETGDMKELFERCYNEHPNIWIDKNDIKNVIINAQMNEGSSMFSNIDFANRADQVKFGSKIVRFQGRILSDIRLDSDGNTRTARQKYKFEKITNKNGNLGNLGNLNPCGQLNDKQNNIIYSNSQKIAKDYQITNPLSLESFNGNGGY
ncbi:MAG TPA: CHC2 zinc finger domain-containing protein [Candidatus Nanoarchaeia archaeon]|nr:CHC2 zinc finger domain-containing protein [Candidatus Nanoarchaeia archaeon]